MLRSLRSSLDDYWPRYLAHHTHRKNRALHDLGDLAVIAGCLSLNPLGLAVGVVTGYGFAFAGHYLIEGRKPATLEHPVLAGLSKRRAVRVSLRAGPVLMSNVRERLFGSVLFYGNHARVDRLGLDVGIALARGLLEPTAVLEPRA